MVEVVILMKNTYKIPDCLIDLHLHLDGSVSPKSARELAEMQGIPVPESDVELTERLSVGPNCRSLDDYLSRFVFPLSLLQTEKAISTAAANLERELQAQGLIYAEIRFAPQLCCKKGLTQEEVLLAAIDGMNRCDLRSNLILCCMRGDDNEAENMETVELAGKYFGKGVCAVDLAGSEASFRTENFRKLFVRAKELGLHITIHAGEAGGPENIRKALELGAERIGHGVHCLEEDTLVSELAERKTPLELCPTSNLDTKIFASYKEYPLLVLKNRGIRVTLNTDNMSASGTNLRREFEALTEAFGLTEQDVRELLLNSADAAFCDEETKAVLKEEIIHAFSA